MFFHIYAILIVLIYNVEYEQREATQICLSKCFWCFFQDMVAFSKPHIIVLKSLKCHSTSNNDI